MNTVAWRWLGLRPIEEVLAIQRELFEQKMKGSPDNVILFAEHPPCITYAQPEELRSLRVPPEILKEKGVDLVGPCRRGGKITFHGPGQLVCYFIVNIKELGLLYRVNQNQGDPEKPQEKPDLVKLVAFIDTSIIEALKQYGLLGCTEPNDPRFEKDQGVRGVWIEGRRKIASRGIKLDWSGPDLISTFGFALNVGTDLAGFSLIYPCGYDIDMTSMENELGRKIDLEEVLLILVNTFQKLLGIPLIFAEEKK